MKDLTLTYALFFGQKGEKKLERKVERKNNTQVRKKK